MLNDSRSDWPSIFLTEGNHSHAYLNKPRDD